MLGLIWFKTVCKCYQQMTLVGKELTLVMLKILCATPPQFCPVNPQHSSCKHAFSNPVESSVDPDQMDKISSEAS